MHHSTSKKGPGKHALLGTTLNLSEAVSKHTAMMQQKLSASDLRSLSTCTSYGRMHPKLDEDSERKIPAHNFSSWLRLLCHFSFAG